MGRTLLVADRLAWNRIVQRGEGYIYNDMETQVSGGAGSRTPREVSKLHLAACPRVKRMTYSTDGRLTKRFFRSRREAIEWLDSHRKLESFTPCTYCNP